MTEIDLGSVNQTGRTTIMSAMLDGLRSRGFLAIMVKPTLVAALEFWRKPGHSFLVLDPILAMARLRDEFGRTDRIAVGLDDTHLFEVQPFLDELDEMSKYGHTVTVITAR